MLKRLQNLSLAATRVVPSSVMMELRQSRLEGPAVQMKGKGELQQRMVQLEAGTPGLAGLGDMIQKGILAGT